MCNATCQQVLLSAMCAIMFVGGVIGLLYYVRWINSKLKGENFDEARHEQPGNTEKD